MYTKHAGTRHARATEPAPTEAARTEAARTEAARTEAARTEPARPKPARTESTRTEPACTEPVRTEPARTKPVRTKYVLRAALAAALLTAAPPAAWPATAAPAAPATKLGACGPGQLCLWPKADFKGPAWKHELADTDIESCVALPPGASAHALANRTGRPVTTYQSAECGETGEFETYPGRGTWVPQSPYAVRAFKLWER